MPFDVDDRFINAAESELQTRFPSSYRSAMRKQNGGAVSTPDDDWELHPVADTLDRKRLARSLNSVVSETLVARDWPGFPYGAVAIANNGAGDLLIFMPKGRDLGAEVFAWRHDSQELDQIAADFSALS